MTIQEVIAHFTKRHSKSSDYYKQTGKNYVKVAKKEYSLTIDTSKYSDLEEMMEYVESKKGNKRAIETFTTAEWQSLAKKHNIPE